MTGEFKGNRGSAQIWLEALVGEEKTNREIIDWLRGQGMGYNDSRMRADINRTRLELLGADQINRLSAASVIPDNLMRERRIDTKFKYSVTIKFDYYDTSTLTTQEQGVTMYYKTAPTQDQVLDDFALRREALERGMIDSPPNVQEIFQVNKIYYYKNRKP